MKRPRHLAQRGAALLAAMLVVVLVATLSAAALWQQHRGTEVEMAERSRVRLGWALDGALRWAQFNLSNDARNSATDNLGEFWATPLEETRISTFLNATPRSGDSPSSNLSVEEESDNAFLNGRIEDAQARFNVASIVQGAAINPAALQAFARVCEQAGVPPEVAQTVAENLRFAADRSGIGLVADRAALPPTQTTDVLRLGLSREDLVKLLPLVAWLPAATPVNVNTASAQVLAAVVPGLDLGRARELVAGRNGRPFATLAEFQQRSGLPDLDVNSGTLAVASRYFEVHGSIRTGNIQQSIQALVQRDGLQVSTVWLKETTGLAPAR